MNRPLSILVVGGYGEFGGRVSELLLLDGHTVFVAGRSLSKATRFTKIKGGIPKVFNRQRSFADVVLSEFDVVVDAAGPFQNYKKKGDDYALARACIDQRVHYLDLSDDGEYTAGIKSLNEQAMESACVVLSGVSSTPAFSSAIVDKLRDQMGSLSLIETTILPGSDAPRGRSVMQAILGQVGNPMKIWRGGRWVSIRGWSNSTPISLPVDSKSFQGESKETRLASFISTPDTVLFPSWFGASSVLFRAGLELEFMHSSLSILGRLRGFRLIPSLTLFYRPLDFLAGALASLGTDTGGMVVSVTGRIIREVSDEAKPSADAGTEAEVEVKHDLEIEFENEVVDSEADSDVDVETMSELEPIAVRRTWSLRAESGKGPYIAAAPVRAIVNQITKLAPGARPCLSELNLDDYLFAAREIATTVDEQEIADPVLMQQVLGSRWLELPRAVKTTHLVHDEIKLVGRGSVIRGEGLISRFVGMVFRFPTVKADVSISVIKRRVPGGEVWIRDFSGHQFQSTLTFDTNDYSEQLLRERFGLLDFELALDVSDNMMSMPVSRGWFFGIPIPKIFLPVSHTSEFEYAKKMHFDVRLELPFSLGLLVHYKGHLTSMASTD
jgi:hypothetical protein